MKSKERKTVRLQNTRVLKSPKDASKTESSQYWDDVASGRYGKDEIGFKEHVQANTDVLCETEISNPSTPQLLMGEAIDHLQGRQLEVYLLTVREGRSLAEAAKLLGIEKSSAQKYRERAIAFLKQYCHAAIAKGRV